MRRSLAALAASLLLVGCAALSSTAPPPSAAALKRADDQMAAAQYRRALALYDEYLKANPNDPAAPRARATRALVERLLASQAEVERLRRDVDTRQAEIDRLKADLERLRRIDLRQAPTVR